MAVREIVEIDQQKCNGCAQCVPACAEGAIAIVNGKARLVSDVYCDGLGACLGHCPQGAIRITRREASAFDEEAVRRRAVGQVSNLSPVSTACPSAAVSNLSPKVPARPAPAACPGAAVRNMMGPGLPLAQRRAGPPAPLPDGALVTWPVQLRLVPPGAPFLAGADVVLAADCVGFAAPDFHASVLRGRPLLIACPKLDDAEFYVEKLAQIFATAQVRSVTVARMEVPCCRGLMRIAQAARELSGCDVALEEVIVTIGGQVPAKAGSS